MSTTTVVFSAFSPFPTLLLQVPSETEFSELHSLLCDRYPGLPSSDELTISMHRGVPPESSTQLHELHSVHSPLVTLRLSPRTRGGKGGFGSQLRAAGGRMSSQKTSNNDSCRDLSGRRLSTVKEAQKLAEYIENEPVRKKAAAEAQKAKLEALERKLGISKDGSSSRQDDEELPEGVSTPRAGPSTTKPGEPEQFAGKKHRFDDTEYLEQSKEIVDNVKSAVSAGLLKRRKKAKLAHKPAGGPVEALASVVEAVVESPATAPVIAVAAVALASGA